jgi:pimeloyl-ACP methyl ester carboxylesterase
LIKEEDLAKPVVVLVPGLGNNARLWAGQVKALSGRHDVVIADYRGAESIEEMADRVLAQVLPARFALVGFSLGGYIALRMISLAAERISRLAFISSSSHADGEQAIRQRHKLIDRARHDYAGLLRDMGNFIVFPDGPNAARARDELVSMGMELGVDEFCRQQTAAMNRPDSNGILGSIQCPVRVLCGQEDKVTPVTGNQFLAESVRGARLEVIEAAGHLLPLERPAEVSRFLQQFLTH